MKLWVGVFKTCSARFFALLLNTASLALTAHILGPEGRGVIAGVTTWVNLAATLGCLSLGQVVVHRSAGQGDRSWMRPIFSALLFSAALLTVITWVVLLSLWLLTPELYGSLPLWGLIMGFVTLPFVIWEGYSGYLLIASGDLSFVNRRLVMAPALCFALLASLLFAGGGVKEALAVTLGMATLVGIVGFYRLWSRADRQLAFAWPVVRALFLDGAKLHLNAIGGVLILGTDVLMVNYYLPSSDVGCYQLALQLLGAMMIIPASVGMVLNQEMGKYGPDRVWPIQKRLLLQVMALMVAGGMFAYGLAPWIVGLIAGPGFGPAVETFRLALFSVAGMTLSYGMSNQWLGRGLFTQTAMTTLAAGIANLMLNIFLVPQIGIKGAALSTVIVYNGGLLLNLGMVAYVESSYRAEQVRAAAA